MIQNQIKHRALFEKVLSQSKYIGIMMNVKDIVCVTTFREGDSANRVERIRTEVFLDTVYRMVSADLSLIIVHTETREETLSTLNQRGITLIQQQSRGMGNIRREAISATLNTFPNATHICWLEPEKPDMVRFIKPMSIKMEQERSVLGLFNRMDMLTYPPEQAYYYLFCRAVATHLVGFDLDYAFGPMMMTSSSVRYFLDYQSEYGDRWDSILVPRLRAIKDSLSISVLSVDFQNDSRMTQVEFGNPDIILKRLEQFNNVIPSLVAELR